ncbi:uncharacterized protein ATNIH1004_011629 [Aspergillus tanneri]|uniref:Uncharacterized protein n=1 Tax=Aspergillus tanneri TaxID=1220188 RepID=A0A5M9M998_9EURO|nr:uncharacterized protein ATNIH1004_011629 [Aspergillus tanneri]KAA8641493.1 hypothetical protein ATNIH1004_011629 [Aspergillus tanneri]
MDHDGITSPIELQWSACIEDAQAMVNDGHCFALPLQSCASSGISKHFLHVKSSGSTIDASSFTAGGRHDNDFVTSEMLPFFRPQMNLAVLTSHSFVAPRISRNFRETNG